MSELPLVLVIDDEERIRRLLVGVMEDQDDLRAAGAASAEQALLMLEAEPADVAVVDLRLPGMDGEAFIVEAHRRGLCRHFILHSGSIDLALSPALTALGMTPDDVMQKPIGTDIILARIRELLNR